MIEHIQAEHEMVRKFVEEKYEVYRVTRVACDSFTEYEQPIHSIMENPDFIPVLTQLRYKVRAINADVPIYWIECEVYRVGEKLEVGGTSTELIRKR